MVRSDGISISMLRFLVALSIFRSFQRLASQPEIKTFKCTLVEYRKLVELPYVQSCISSNHCTPIKLTTQSSYMVHLPVVNQFGYRSILKQTENFSMPKSHFVILDSYFTKA